MTIYYAIVFLIFGLVFGSFYNVVGYRLPKKESLAFPSSHCTVCNHKLGPLELIPVFSFIFLGGKCKKCKTKISWYYSIFELFTGLLFMFSYLKFGFSAECFISIALSSILVITIISDYKYFIIPDEIIVIGIITVAIGAFFRGGMGEAFEFIEAIKDMGVTLLNGLLSFGFMFVLKLIGDFIFKKESMGGGDIKLMFVIGMVLGFPTAIASIFLSSFIALPIALILTYKKSNHEIPFGPFLSIATLILYFFSIEAASFFTILA